MELTDICTQLKEKRLKKKISLQDVSKQTKLHPSMLRSIEEVKDLEDVGKFYLKGFLKIYAQFLGEGGLMKDIDEVFTQEKQKKSKFAFRKEPPQTKTAAPKEAAAPKETAKVAVAETPPAPEATTPPLSQAAKKWSNRKVLYVILAAVSLIALARIAGRNKTESPEIPLKDTQAPGLVPKVARTLTPQDTARPLVSVLTKGDVLVEVRTDGKLIFQNIIIKGSKESWMADEKLEVKISNPSLVSLEIDNQIIPTSNTKRPALYVITSEGFRVEK
jgi:transcriptional regulator with XRE-family HTH domain